MDANFWPGLMLALLIFGMWGIGFNTAVVSYLSLASDMSPSHLRSRTIAVMWFMMITAVIGTAIGAGRAGALHPRTADRGVCDLCWRRVDDCHPWLNWS